MKLSILLLSACATLGLGACHYGHHHGHPHEGHFCPPGQAKKGNC